ncbi:MAG: tRNA epoxyqueuosine(34) reductase QueG [Alphaproteobacteria bacterium 64-6]|nr:MAG: tRNA epoxyqueuosine(34) reductase QueG [Alphaproteobacteria bacterium 64-6]
MAPTLAVRTRHAGDGATRPTDSAQDARALVAREAAAAGFSVVRIARVSDLGAEPGRRFLSFIADGQHGDMDWLEAKAERRQHPNAMWAEARSAIVLGLSYAPEEDPLRFLDQRDRASISVYAARRDYHDVVKPRLKRVARALQAATGEDVKVFVDTAPLMEKPLAALAGLGWQGKHTNLVSREHGSWLYLGVILTRAEIAADEPERDHCGRCRRCLDICPTAAFPAPYRLDARRCISYLTIEHKGPIPHEFREAIGNRIFGCDDCLAVCPWNKFAQASHDQQLAIRPETQGPRIADLLALDDTAFRERFAGTPIRRAGHVRFMRNVLIAAGNSSDTALVPLIEALLAHEAPVVRGAAVWALSRLVPRAHMTKLAAAHGNDTDASVREEWTAALAS